MRVLINETILIEYSDNVINQLISRFKKTNPFVARITMKDYIERFEELKKTPKIKEKDITKYTWAELEQIVDLNQSKRIKTSNIKISNSEYIYNDNGLKIVVGNDLKSCVKYGNGYSFCISARGEENAFEGYRYGLNFTPYFILDEERTKELKTNNLFIDPLHLIVLMVREVTNKNGAYYEYQITSANNDGDERYTDWDDVVRIQPKLKGLKKLIVPKIQDKQEKERYEIKKEYENALFYLNDDYDVIYKIHDIDKKNLKIINGLMNGNLQLYWYYIYDNDFDKHYHVIPEKTPDRERWAKHYDVKLTQVSVKKLNHGDTLNEYLQEVKKIILDYYNKSYKNKLQYKK